MALTGNTPVAPSGDGDGGNNGLKAALQHVMNLRVPVSLSYSVTIFVTRLQYSLPLCL